MDNVPEKRRPRLNHSIQTGLRTPADSASETASTAPADQQFRAGKDALAQGDRASAERMLSLAAKSGSVDALVSLGALRLELGKLEGSDSAEEYFRAAADDGHPVGMFNLGQLRTAQGRIRRPEDDCASYWLRKAAEAGHARAAEAFSDLPTSRLGRFRLRRSAFQLDIERDGKMSSEFE